MTMIEEENQSSIDSPQIKINSVSSEFLSHDDLNVTNVVYAEPNPIYADETT